MTIRTETPSANTAAFASMGAAVAPNSLPGAVNWDASMLPKLVASLAKTKSGGGDTFIDFVGDSTVRAGLNGGLYTVATSLPVRFAAELTQRGYVVSTDGVAGASNLSTTAAYVAIDPRLAFGAGWSILTQGTAGGYIFTNSSDTTSMSLTTALSFDRVDVFVYESGTSGTWTLNVNGGAASAATGGTSFTAKKYTINISGSAGDTINLQRTGAGGTIYILGMRSRLSTASRVYVGNCGWATSNTVNWTSTTNSPYDPQSIMVLRAATGVFMALGVNDWNPTVTPLSTYAANYQTLITRFSTFADVALLGQPQSDPTSFSSVATQATYLAVQQAAALSNTKPWSNLQYRWGSYANANANGLMGDQRHPNTAGTTDWGGWQVNLLTQR